jgi:predicted NBD/HSP70 family sugar kinase
VKFELEKGKTSSFYEQPENLSFPMVLKALQEGDELTRQTFREAAQILGMGITGVLNSFNPERVIIGGKVPRAFPEMIDIAAQTARERVISVFRDKVCVVPEELGERSALIGAAALVLEELFTLQWMKS